MRTMCFIIAAAALASAALGQDSNATAVATNAVSEAKASSPTSVLTLDSRTDMERIDFLLNVANVYFQEKEYAAAVSAYERVLEIDPTHQQARYTLGHMYIEAKQFEKAEEQLLALLEAYPEDYQLLNNLAWLYATAEDPQVRDGKKAIKIAQEAMVIAPNDHHVWSTLSEAYYVSGDYEKALRAIEHMARVASRYAKNITKDEVDAYNAQIRKCQRAMEAQEALDSGE